MLNSCKNCKHYIPHYVKFKMRLCEVNGHCGNEIIINQTENFNVCNDCPYWEQSKSEKQTSIENTKAILSDLNRRLEDISLILREEDEK